MTKMSLGLFQFQYGTIKAPLSRQAFHSLFHFNSSMVRLKQSYGLDSVEGVV